MRTLIKPGIAAGVVLTAALMLPARPSLQEPTGLLLIAPASLSNLRAWDQQVDAMVRAGELRLHRMREDTLLANRVHERFAQYQRGVRVFGGEIVRQQDNGVTVSILGAIYQGIRINITPALSREEGRSALETVAGVSLAPDRSPELVVLPLDNIGYALAYAAQVVTEGDVLVYFVDANTGRLVKRYSNLQTAAAVGEATGVLGDRKKISTDSFAATFITSDELRPPAIISYDMKGDVTRTIRFLNGFITLGMNDIASDSDNVWTDGANADAHVYAGYTYDYFFKRFGRRGLDNNDMPIRSVVHPVRRQDLTSYSNDIIAIYYLNAFYLGGTGIVVYGEGLPPPFVLASTRQSVNFFSGGLDIAAHELTHGVTDFSSGLIYENEPGALNEAFSDIMGTAVEFFYQPAGGGPLRADYLIGEDVFTPGGVRSMADPAAFGDPDHYSRRFTGTQDNGGVHINSGIPNHAFYLAIEGGRNRTSGLSVQGVGPANREQIERVFYRAFVFLLPSNAAFVVARAATLQAARDLYGSGSAVEQAIAQAWTAVGVN